MGNRGQAAIREAQGALVWRLTSRPRGRGAEERDRTMRNWLRAAGWWASDYSFVLYWQARGVLNRAEPEALRTGEGTPIVVLPGVYEPWKFLLPLVEHLRESGRPVHVIPDLGLNVRPVPEAAAIVSAYLEQHGLADAVIFAHSKGGLIGKAVMAGTQAGHRIKGMVAVATPFAGSVYARYMLAPSLRIFSPRDATIRALGSDESINARIVSIYGVFDPHIPARSTLAGATNVELDTGGHFRILAKPRVLAELELLAQRRT